MCVCTLNLKTFLSDNVPLHSKCVVIFFYRKQQDVANGKSRDDIWYEPGPQVIEPDPLEIQDGFLRTRTEQRI